MKLRLSGFNNLMAARTSSASKLLCTLKRALRTAAKGDLLRRSFEHSDEALDLRAGLMSREKNSLRRGWPLHERHRSVNNSSDVFFCGALTRSCCDSITVTQVFGFKLII